MSDLGSIGTLSNVGHKGYGYFPYGGLYLHGVMIQSRIVHVTNALRDDAIGNPVGPSQRQDGSGILGPDGMAILWPIHEAGTRTFNIDVKYIPDIAPRPRIIAKANPEVGLLTELIDEAASSASWQTLTVSFSAIAVGVVEVWREVPSGYQDARTWWDNARTE